MDKVYLFHAFYRRTSKPQKQKSPFNSEVLSDLKGDFCVSKPCFLYFFHGYYEFFHASSGHFQSNFVTFSTLKMDSWIIPRYALDSIEKGQTAR
jgi:hypothetical protein